MGGAEPANYQSMTPTIPGYRMLRLDLHISRGGWLLVVKHAGPRTFLPEAGYAVAVVDYRPSGEARFPLSSTT